MYLIPLFYNIRPNLITLLGFFGIILSYVVSVYYSPTASEVMPSWVYVLNAACMFFYQTMDALDGKQARRTGTSSALGELFDHGCDAMTTVFATSVVSCSLQIGFGWDYYFSVILLLIPFYFSQWEVYYTGSLNLWYINVTEGQFTAMFVHIIGAIMGPNFYLNTVTILNYSIPYYHIVLVPCYVVSIVMGIIPLFRMLVLGIGNNRIPSLLTAMPGVFAITLFTIYTLLSPELLFEYAHWHLAMIGFLVAGLVGRLVLFRVCKLPFYPLQLLLLPLPFAVLNSLFGFVNNYLLLKALTIYAGFTYLHFGLGVIQELTNFLDIQCLRIPVKKID
eukprot:TRINITY_DN6295_c0_g1_i1.p1 TRINITY_DN6295_c0_g1~~TRINITY_DN6295_c0_g1_i1.p1  ORF type:complete len:334 (-),score=37.21 TRINITY_DN6295_c0_g1_i1:28-1029(-)